MTGAEPGAAVAGCGVGAAASGAAGLVMTDARTVVGAFDFLVRAARATSLRTPGALGGRSAGASVCALRRRVLFAGVPAVPASAAAALVLVLRVAFRVSVATGFSAVAFFSA